MYKYEGLYEDPGFTKKFSFEGSSFRVPPTKTYYARFTPNYYTVKYYDVSFEEYKKNPDIRPIKEQSKPYGSKVVYRPEEYGDRFTGWDPYYVHGPDLFAVSNWDSTVLAYEMRLFMKESPRIIFHFDDWDLVSEGKLVFTAQYEQKPADKHTITFDTAGGSYIAPITLSDGVTITKPDDPSREGYEFKGWKPGIPRKMPAQDITCTAQ